MTDIVGKPREGFPCLEGGSDHTCRVRDAASGCLCATAADTITALRAEVEKLRAALWDIHAVCNNWDWFIWMWPIRRIKRLVCAALKEKQ